MKEYKTIAFDLDGTCVGHWRLADGTLHTELRPGIERWIRWARKNADRVILWTHNSLESLKSFARKWPILATFDDYITVENTPSFPIKDVRKVDVCLLIDNDPAHRAWGKNWGIEDRYMTVETYGGI